MDAGRCAGIFAERPTEWIAVSNPSAGNQRFCNYVYMYMSALCTCTRIHYAAIHVTCVLVGIRLYTSTGPVASLKPSTVHKHCIIVLTCTCTRIVAKSLMTSTWVRYGDPLSWPLGKKLMIIMFTKFYGNYKFIKLYKKYCQNG